MPATPCRGWCHSVVEMPFSVRRATCDWQFAEHPNDERAAQADWRTGNRLLRAAYNKMLDELTAPCCISSHLHRRRHKRSHRSAPLSSKIG